jgi:hypothetical protein
MLQPSMTTHKFWSKTYYGIGIICKMVNSNMNELSLCIISQYGNFMQMTTIIAKDEL